VNQALRLVSIGILAGLAPLAALANMHQMDMNAMVMNGNSDRLPLDCERISEDVSITVRAGVDYAMAFNGRTFGYDSNEWRVPPCARVNVTFINEDDIRHQWMVHGLPRYLYDQGMFHMELNHAGQTTGQFIVPGDVRTYLVHCDIAQHTENGMKAQLKVGGGSGDLHSVPGISGDLFADDYSAVPSAVPGLTF
jgi:plastocyanin